MEGECKVQLDASVPTEDRKHTTTQGFRPSSKLTTALLAFTLCLAVAASALLFFNSNTKGLQQDEDDYGDLRHTLRQISDGKAAIHLEGRRGETSVQWKVDENHSHSQGGLQLVDNEIVIPRRGLYFVYSQASFSVNCSGGDEDYEDSMVHLSHTVRRWSRSFGKYEIILNSVRTACQRMVSTDEIEDGNWYTAIYVGAVFDLHKGDKLKAGMEKKMLQDLQEEAGKTFFGVFAL